LIFPPRVPKMLACLAREVHRSKLRPPIEKPNIFKGEDPSSWIEPKKEIDLEFKEALKICKEIKEDVNKALTLSIADLEEQQKNFEQEVKEKYEDKKKKINEEMEIWNSFFK